MKISKRVNDAVTIHAEADTMTELFEQLAQLEEVFSINYCFKCRSNKGVRHIVREIDGNKFYEVSCKHTDCKAKFSFGVHKKGHTLFPHHEKGWKTVEELMKAKDEK